MAAGRDARLARSRRSSTAPGWSSTAPCWSSTTSTASRSRGSARRRRPDRPLGRRGGLRPLDLPLGRRLRRAACSPTGRTSTWSCACAGSGLRCALAADAIGDHEHSATLGSGSARKNYLMGYGRGYVLRKWQVLDAAATGPVLLREARPLRRPGRRRPQPRRGPRPAARLPRGAGERSATRTALGLGATASGAARDPAPAGAAALAAASRDRRRPRTAVARRLSSRRHQRPLALARGGARLARRGRVRSTSSSPGPGTVGEVLGERARGDPARLRGADQARSRARAGWRASCAGCGATCAPSGGSSASAGPELVISVTTMLPAVTIAAWLERVPALVYCGELFDRGYRGGPLRALASRALAVLTARLSAVIIACSQTVAGQFVRRLGEDRDRLPAGRRALLARRRRRRLREQLRDRRRRAGARLGRQPHRGPRPGPARAGDAGDPRAPARTPAACSPAIRSRARRTSPTASGWSRWSTSSASRTR